MTLNTLERRAEAIIKTYDIRYVVLGTLVRHIDPRLAVAEHVLHELSHAALLGQRFVSDRRIALRLNDLATSEADENEVHVFAVVAKVLASLGLQYPVQCRLAVLNVKDMNYWQDDKVIAEWRLFRRTAKYKRAVRRVQKFWLDGHIT